MIRTDIYSATCNYKENREYSKRSVILFLHCFSGTACFFVKWFLPYYYVYGSDTGQIQSNGSWGNLSFLGYSDNSCLDPAAQFRFRDNGAMLRRHAGMSRCF
jgi:hypothetical protein